MDRFEKRTANDRPTSVQPAEIGFASAFDDPLRDLGRGVRGDSPDASARDGEGRVSLHDLARSKARLAKSNDGIFCAMRGWDQRTERGYMKRIEGEFLCLQPLPAVSARISAAGALRDDPLQARLAGPGELELRRSANARAAVQMRRCRPFHNWEARACR